MNNFKATTLLILFILFFGNCFAQKTFENHEMVLKSILGNKIISIKEGKYIQVSVNQRKFKGKLHILNDSLIELKNNKILIGSIDKIRIGRLSTNITFATIGSVVSASTLTGGTALIVVPLTESSGFSGVLFFISLPILAIGTFATIYTVRKISNIIWKQRKHYRIQIQVAQ